VNLNCILFKHLYSAYIGVNRSEHFCSVSNVVALCAAGPQRKIVKTRDGWTVALFQSNVWWSKFAQCAGTLAVR